MSLIINAMVFISAGTANPGSTKQVDVLAFEKVSPFAMRLHLALAKMVASLFHRVLHVVFLRAQEKMVRVKAWRIIAVMENPLRGIERMVFVKERREPMDAIIDSFPADHAVPVRITCSHPVPASGDGVYRTMCKKFLNFDHIQLYHCNRVFAGLILILGLLAAPAFGQYTIGQWTAATAGTGGSTAATPTFSPAAGTYSSTQTVTISTATPLAVLCYTTDGSTPTESANLCSGGTTSTYVTPITVSTTQTVEAIATLAGYTDSSVRSALYTISAGPTFVNGNSFSFTGSAAQNIGFTVGAGHFVVLTIGLASASIPVPAMKIGSTSMVLGGSMAQTGHGSIYEFYLYDTAGGDTQFTPTCSSCSAAVFSVGILEFSGTSSSIAPDGTFQSNQLTNSVSVTPWTGTPNYTPSGTVLAIGIGAPGGCNTQITGQTATSPWSSGTTYQATVFSTESVNLMYQLSTSSATATAGAYSPTAYRCYVTIMTGGYL